MDEQQSRVNDQISLVPGNHFRAFAIRGASNYDVCHSAGKALP